MTANIKYTGLLLALLISSCSKLNETIYDEQSSASYITNEAGVTSAIRGAYGMLENSQLFKTEGYNLLTLAADDISALPNGSFNSYSQKIYDPGLQQINWVYAKFYAIINNCNFLLKNLQDLNFSATYKVRAEGQIKFLRAVSYFYLVRMFGDVPLRTTPTDANTEFFISRNNVGQVDSLIFADLKTASANLLPKSKPDGIGIGNKGAAQAMLSLAYLTYGNYLDLNSNSSGAVQAYTFAKDYADSVILSGEYSLVQNYADLWNVANEKNAYATEVVWGLRFTRDNVGKDLGSLGSEFALRYMPYTMANVTGNTPNSGAGSESFKVQPWFYDFCTTGDYAGDYRADVTFLTKWTNFNDRKLMVTYPGKPADDQTSVDQPYLYKYVDAQGVDSRNNENDLFVIRLAEVYLIKAEAINEISGPNPEAYTAFNMLRARARNANGVKRTTPENLQPGLIKDAFRMKVFNERGLELIGECHRWFDLVRMKSPTGNTMYQYQFGTYLPTVPRGLPVWNPASKQWLGGRMLSNNVVPYNSRFLLFPIPLRETDMNPLIKQNPGYN